MADWNEIKTEYITTDTSYRKLAEKYGLNRTLIASRGKTEQWPTLRSQHRDKTLSKALDKIASKQAQKMARFDAVAEKLLQKLERAVEELDIQIVRESEKIKQIEYNNADRPDKPTKEVIHEKETVQSMASIIDRQGLKQIASALRDLKEVQMLRSELDRKEQEARIANLQKHAASQDDDKQIEVVFGGDAEEFSQ